MRLWRPGDPTDPENCPVCGGNPSSCDHPTIRPPKPKSEETKRKMREAWVLRRQRQVMQG